MKKCVTDRVNKHTRKKSLDFYIRSLKGKQKK